MMRLAGRGQMQISFQMVLCIWRLFMQFVLHACASSDACFGSLREDKIAPPQPVNTVHLGWRYLKAVL
jgi:hypothetical protein